MMESKAAIIVSCWFTIATISSVYMFVVFMPIGFLILVAVMVTFLVLSTFETEKK